MKKINTDFKKNVVNYILNILNLKFGKLQNYIENFMYDNKKLDDNFSINQENSIIFDKNEKVESKSDKNLNNIENYINNLYQHKNFENKNTLERLIQRINNSHLNKKTNIINQQKNILDFIWNKTHIQDNEKKYSLPQLFFSQDENLIHNALIKDSQNYSFVKTINGSHKSGLLRVPYDGNIAETHKNEAILNAEDANVWRNLQFIERGDGKEFDTTGINLNYTPTINISNTSNQSVEEDLMKILNYHKDEIYKMLANVVNRNNAKSYI